MIRSCACCLILLASFVRSDVARGDEPGKTISVRVGLGMTRTLELRPRATLRSGKLVRSIHNRKGERLITCEYTMKEGEVVDIRVAIGEEGARPETAAEVRPGSDPDTLRITGRQVGTAVYSVTGDGLEKQTFRIATVQFALLLAGRSLRMQMDPPRPLKEVIAANPRVMSARVCPSNRTYAVINALAPGRTPFGLVADDGTRQTVDLTVMGTDADRKTVFLPSGESMRIRLSNGAPIQAAMNDNDMIMEVRVSDPNDVTTLRLKGRNPGVANLTLTGTDRKSEDFDVVVTEPRRTLLLGRTVRIQASLPQPLKAVAAADPKCLEVSIDPKDATTALVRALQEGDTRVTLTAEDGGKDLADYRVYSDKPRKGRVILAQYEAKTLTMPDGEEISSVESSAEQVVSLLGQPGRPLRIVGLNPGVARLAIKGRDHQIEREVVVVEPKGKEIREREPLRVEVDQEFGWKELNVKNYHRFLVEDWNVVSLDLRPEKRNEDGLVRKGFATFTGQSPGRTKIIFLRDDEGNRDVVEVIVSPRK